jgi:hypothetical protein
LANSSEEKIMREPAVIMRPRPGIFGQAMTPFGQAEHKSVEIKLIDLTDRINLLRAAGIQKILLNAEFGGSWTAFEFKEVIDHVKKDFMYASDPQLWLAGTFTPNFAMSIAQAAPVSDIHLGLVVKAPQECNPGDLPSYYQSINTAKIPFVVIEDQRVTPEMYVELSSANNYFVGICWSGGANREIDKRTLFAFRRCKISMFGQHSDADYFGRRDSWFEGHISSMATAFPLLAAEIARRSLPSIG